MSSISDIALVTRARVLRDDRAFARLVDKYQAAVRRFFLSQTLGDEPLSDDLAQDTFVKAYVCLGQFRGTARFSTWLYRIAYNVYCDHVRRQRPTADVDTVAATRPDGSVRDTSLRLDLYDALRRLGEAERTCITLQLIDGYSIDKISGITGMAQGTVKSHLSRGKAKMALFLKQNGYDGK